MKRILFIGLFLLTAITAFGQINTDSIEIKKSLGTVFRQNGRNLTPRQLLIITESNPEAHKEMKIAKGNFDASFVFGYAGGFLVGWPLGTAVAGGEPNWTLAGVGAGLIAVSIPFSAAYTRHAKNAVRIYNGSRPMAFNNLDFKIGLTGNGIGIKITF